MSENHPYPEVQPRYAAYCVAHGKDPEAMLSHDRRKWPGGQMAGYILWIAEMKAGFKKAHPQAFLGSAIVDQEGFTRFIFEKVGIKS